MDLTSRIGRSGRELILPGGRLLHAFVNTIVLTRLHPRYCRFAPFVYTDDAKQVLDVLWEETLDEFAFVNAREIVNNMQTA